MPSSMGSSQPRSPALQVDSLLSEPPGKPIKLIAEEGFLISAWLSGEALQIAVKRREVKSKEEKERYKHQNAEFQRIARRDKKAFSETTYFELKTTLGAEYRERQGN